MAFNQGAGHIISIAAERHIRLSHDVQKGGEAFSRHTRAMRCRRHRRSCGKNSGDNHRTALDLWSIRSISSITDSLKTFEFQKRPIGNLSSSKLLVMRIAECQGLLYRASALRAVPIQNCTSIVHRDSTYQGIQRDYHQTLKTCYAARLRVPRQT